jgi:CBS domain-containing protein
MTPLSSFPVMDAQTPALDALEMLDDDDDPPCVVVTEGDSVVGVVSRSDLYGYMRARRAFGV